MKRLALLLALTLSCSQGWGQGLQFDRIRPAAVNNTYYVEGRAYTTIQAAITAAGTTGSVVIPSSYAGFDTYTNPNGILIFDYRGGVLKLGVGSAFNAPSATFGTTGTVGAVSVYSNGSGSPSAANNVSFGGDSNHAVVSENTGPLLAVLKNPVYAGVTVPVGTSLIGAGACASDVAVAYTNALSTDTLIPTGNAAPPAGNNLLTYKWWVTPGNVNLRVCNNTGAGITPTAETFNVRIGR